MAYWTNASVLALAGSREPVEAITSRARQITFEAAEAGWTGPPYDPLALAEHLKVPVVPVDDVYDARTVRVSARSVRIEFNPNRPAGRLRFSVAHELVHTFFPDVAQAARHRALATDLAWTDDWQLELLCNIGAAELLMPIGSFPAIAGEALSIEHLMQLRTDYQVSAEALLLRVAKLTNEPMAVFAAAHTRPDDPKSSFRLDYTMPSASWPLRPLPRGLEISKTVLSECTAVGFTAKAEEKWTTSQAQLWIECVGMPPYPGHRYPRVGGLIRPKGKRAELKPAIQYLWGDATIPRGEGPKILAHIVNDGAARWGAGFARVVGKKWPNVQQDFRAWAEERNLRLGKVRRFELTSDLAVVHMVAQRGYGPSPKPRIRYGPLLECLQELAALAKPRNAAVHMPRIGTGLSDPTVRSVVRGRRVSTATALKVMHALDRNPPNARLLALLNWGPRGTTGLPLSPAPGADSRLGLSSRLVIPAR